MHLLNLRNKDETAHSFALKELEQAKSFFDRIPFELRAAPLTDSLYSEKSLARLRRGIAQLDAGKGMQHDLNHYD